MKHPLISITDWPTMPAPMQSEDEGEAWIWGDFVLVLQKNPATCQVIIADMVAKMSKKRTPPQVVPSAMEYPYALVVFYKKHRNPHGPSSQPILCTAIERANYDALRSLLHTTSSAVSGDLPMGKGPLIVGVFKSEGRFNLGEFDGYISKESAREKLFEVARDHLNLTGSPQHIGNIRAIHGHPETGWPPITKAPRNSGCLGVLFCVFMFFILISCYC
jgi:hypothetical protein